MAPDVVDKEMVPKILARMKPYMDGTKQPQLKNWYVLLWPGGGTIGARVVDEKRIGDLERIVRDEITVGFPDTRVFTEEGNLFGGFGGSARSVSIHLQGDDSAKLYKVAEAGPPAARRRNSRARTCRRSRRPMRRNSNCTP